MSVTGQTTRRRPVGGQTIAMLLALVCAVALLLASPTQAALLERGAVVRNSETGAEYEIVRALSDVDEHNAYVSKVHSMNHLSPSEQEEEIEQAKRHHRYALSLLQTTERLVSKSKYGATLRAINKALQKEHGMKLNKHVSSGTFGAVYKATIKKSGKDVAIKIFNTDVYEWKARANNNVAEKEGLVSREPSWFAKHFWQMEYKELDRIAALGERDIPRPWSNGKKHILNYLDKFEEDGDFFITYELYDGTLENLAGPRYNVLLNSITKQLALGLGYLEKIKVLHHDIKPENLLYQDTSTRKDMSSVHVVFADFGLMVYIGIDGNEALRESCSKRGTPALWPPENSSNSCETYKSAIPNTDSALFGMDTFGIGVSILELGRIRNYLAENPMSHHHSPRWDSLRCMPKVLDDECRLFNWEYYSRQEALTLAPPKQEQWDNHWPEWPIKCVAVERRNRNATWYKIAKMLSNCPVRYRLSGMDAYIWASLGEVMRTKLKALVMRIAPAPFNDNPNGRKLSYFKSELASLHKYHQRLHMICTTFEYIGDLSSKTFADLDLSAEQPLPKWEFCEKVKTMGQAVEQIIVLGNMKAASTVGILRSMLGATPGEFSNTDKAALEAAKQNLLDATVFISNKSLDAHFTDYKNEAPIMFQWLFRGLGDGGDLAPLGELLEDYTIKGTVPKCVKKASYIIKGDK